MQRPRGRRHHRRAARDRESLVPDHRGRRGRFSSPLARSTSNGETIDAPVTWRTADATVTVDERPGSSPASVPAPGRVQAASGSLSSDFLSFTVLARADTLIIVGRLDRDGDRWSRESPVPLVVRLESFNRPERWPTGRWSTRSPARSPADAPVSGAAAATCRAPPSPPERWHGRRTSCSAAFAGTTPPDTRDRRGPCDPRAEARSSRLGAALHRRFPIGADHATHAQ